MQNLRNEIQIAVNFYQSKNFLKAERLTKQLIDKNPKVVFLYNLLGLIYASQNSHDEAIKHYEKGTNVDPTFAMLYNNLGNSYKYKKEYEKAESFYKKAIKINASLPEAHNNLGNLYKDQNKITDAISCLEKSIKINPKFYIAHYNLGTLHKSMGNFSESKKCFNIAIQLHPKFYNAHRAYSQVKNYQENDKHIQIMENLYKQSSIDIFGKIELSFALGKAYDEINNFKKAFFYFDNGNKLIKSKINYSYEKEKKEFLNLKDLFTEIFIKENNEFGNKNTTPIFILGMPRSGTTLVEQIISSHPDVYGGDELNFFNNLIKEKFYKNNEFSIDAVNKINEKTIKNIGDKYISQINQLSNNFKRVTDKLPINFKWIGFINLVFPNSRIIHCTRNPKDISLSLFKNLFTNTELNYAYKLDDIINFYNLYEDLMNFWQRLFPKSIIEIKYEELIKNPKKEIPNIIKLLDLEWNDKCLNFYDNKRVIKTASDTQARKKIYKNSLNVWKNYEPYIKDELRRLKN